MKLTDFEIVILRCLQRPLPLCDRPFLALAQSLETDENQVLQTIRRLQDQNVIRRFRPHLSYRALGRIASLVTAHVPADRFNAVADTVSRMEGVSHNYCRDHYYNLWFTLQSTSLIAIDIELASLREDFQIEFHSLPAIRLFKLDVHFDPAGPAPFAAEQPREETKEVIFSDMPLRPVELTENEKDVLNLIQQELPIMECPFDELAERSRRCGLSGGHLIQTLQDLTQKRVLVKISAVPDYLSLGYTANVMFCADVSPDRISRAGMTLARGSMVSHCYERKTFNGWPFNLYAMCHAASHEHIADFAQSFCAACGITNFKLLPTLREFKKEPVKLEIK